MSRGQHAGANIGRAGAEKPSPGTSDSPKDVPCRFVSVRVGIDGLIQRAPPIPPTLHARRVVGDWMDFVLAFFEEAPALEAYACPRLGIMVSIFLIL